MCRWKAGNQTAGSGCAEALRQWWMKASWPQRGERSSQPCRWREGGRSPCAARAFRRAALLRCMPGWRASAHCYLSPTVTISTSPLIKAFKNNLDDRNPFQLRVNTPAGGSVRLYLSESIMCPELVEVQHITEFALKRDSQV